MKFNMFNLLLSHLFSFKDRSDADNLAKLTSIMNQLFIGDEAFFKQLPTELKISFIDKV